VELLAHVRDAFGTDERISAKALLERLHGLPESVRRSPRSSICPMTPTAIG
jgi:hypothetical protein